MKTVLFLLFRFLARGTRKVSNIFWVVAQKTIAEDYQQRAVIGSTRYNMVSSPDEPYYADQYWNIILPYLINTPNNARIVDLGCSQGRLTKKMGEHFTSGKVFGCDISTSAIEQAKIYVEKSSLKNVDFQVQSISECLRESENNSCDVILLTEVAFFYPDWKDDLSNVIDALKSGGILVMSFRSQYFNAMCIARSRRWESVQTILDYRKGAIFDPITSFTWQTSEEIRSLFLGTKEVELLDLRGIGVCSGINGDPHDFICQPSQLNDDERVKLMELEIELGKSAPDGGRYMLAIVRKL